MPSEFHNGWRVVEKNEDLCVASGIRKYRYVKFSVMASLPAIVADAGCEGWEYVRTVEYEFSPPGRPSLEVEFVRVD